MPEILTPELVARANATETSGSAVDVAEDVDLGIRFPLMAIVNWVDIQSDMGTDEVDGRHRASFFITQGETGGGGGDDINSNEICITAFRSVAAGTAASFGQFAHRFHQDWYGLRPEARPFALDGFSFVVDNVDGAAATVIWRLAVGYQIARTTAEEFASLRAALP